MASKITPEGKKKICVITGTRAEYGLLYNLLKELDADPVFELYIIITGMHLSAEFGLTFKEIERDFCHLGERIYKVEMLLSSDSSAGICKSMGLAQISVCEVYSQIKPDLIVVLGDRYEIFSCVASAMICNIPVAHLHGGEATEGLIDEAIRHSITKMSHLHFTATENYKKRVVQLGEQPSCVFNVGGFGIDNIKKMTFLKQNELEERFKMKLSKRNFLITFHPVTLEDNSAKHQFRELLDALDSFISEPALSDTTLIFTKANADTNGRIINKMIDEFVVGRKNAFAFTSMGSLGYLSTMALSSIVLGNSSSGIAEAPSLKVATINIGDRQKGRIRAKSIIDCAPDKKEILKAIKHALSTDFQAALKNVKNPYGEGNAAKQTKDIIKEQLFKLTKEELLKKRFYDVEF